MTRSGRHFLQIPGPTNVPERVLRAIDRATIDHRGPEFAELGREVVAGLKRVFRTAGPVLVYPSSGTGAWEAALVNTLSPGDEVLMFETGHFALLWRQMAEGLGLSVEFVAGDWRHGAAAALLLGLEGALAFQRDRIFPLHAGHQPALRPARIAAHPGRGRPRGGLRPPRPPRRGHPQRGARLGAGGALARRARAVRL